MGADTATPLLSEDPVRAVRVLRGGGLAALPTETVYGLGAAASDPHAVARVYAVKGRPANHPLIVHLSGVDRLEDWARVVPAYARRLAEACWPGALTLVLPRADHVGDHVTGGQDTVALRVPDHPLTLRVLRAVRDGVAAPSANRYGRVSPTSARHVLDEVGDLLDPSRDVVLDGGPCRLGVESTIVDATGDAPRVLRPGEVDADRVAAIAGIPLDRRPSPVRAPGTAPSHYAPLARVRLVDRVPTTHQRPPGAHPVTGLVALADVPTPAGVVRLTAPVTVAQYAASLYAALREADALRLDEVLAVPPAGTGLAVAVRDRLTRATAGG